MKEPLERLEYRIKCKHFLPCTDGCAKHSGSFSAGENLCGHISIACTGQCERMRRFDKKYGITSKTIKI